MPKSSFRTSNAKFKCVSLASPLNSGMRRTWQDGDKSSETMLKIVNSISMDSKSPSGLGFGGTGTCFDCNVVELAADRGGVSRTTTNELVRFEQRESITPAVKDEARSQGTKKEISCYADED